MAHYSILLLRIISCEKRFECTAQIAAFYRRSGARIMLVQVIPVYAIVCLSLQYAIIVFDAARCLYRGPIVRLSSMSYK